MRLKTFLPSDVAEKNVLMRVDFNVPQGKDGEVLDLNRLQVHLQSINDLLKAGANVALISHLGRPKGKINPKYTLKPVAEELSRLINLDVVFVDDCIGDRVANIYSGSSVPSLVLLENVRFYGEEEANDSSFAKKLAAPFDVFVMDAFSAAHRAHASTSAITNFIPSFAGPSLENEINILSQVRDNPKQPFVLILGGAKVSDKIGVIEKMLEKVQKIIIGGGMAFTFLKVEGYEIGKSLCDFEKLDFARQMLSDAKRLGVEILLPRDVIVAPEISDESPFEVTDIELGIAQDAMGVDIGPKTAELFIAALDNAKTVLWNGPMGVFEIEQFAQGSKEIAKKLVEITQDGALTVIGGGDSAAAINKFGLEKDVSHVSTGGGASLEFFEGKDLPGISPFQL